MNDSEFTYQFNSDKRQVAIERGFCGTMILFRHEAEELAKLLMRLAKQMKPNVTVKRCRKS
jgi:hypothetical protein